MKCKNFIEKYIDYYCVVMENLKYKNVKMVFQLVSIVILNNML